MPHTRAVHTPDCRSLEDDAIRIKWQADEAADADGAAGGAGGAGQQQQQARLSFASASGGSAGVVLETSGLGRAGYFRFRKLQRMTGVF